MELYGVIATFKADTGTTAAMAETSASTITTDDDVNAVADIYRPDGVMAQTTLLTTPPDQIRAVSAAMMYSTQTTVTETWYYQFGGQVVAMRQAIDGVDQGVQFLLSDHLGSTSVAYNPDTGETTRQYYYPWGGLRGSTDPVLDTDIGYTGQTHDGSTGLMYYGARYYDPTIGRFISADTIVPNPADPQQLNRYSYVTNNPVLYTDPSGHCRLHGSSQVIYAGSCNGINIPYGDSWIESQPTTYNPSYPYEYPQPTGIDKFVVDIFFGWVDDAGTLADSDSSTGSKALAAFGLFGGPVFKGFGKTLSFFAKHGDEMADVARIADDVVDDAADVSNAVRRAAGWSDEIADGARLAADDALDAAEDFLGAGYRDLGNGRYLSVDGTRQVRMGDLDITGQHAGGPHMNFERLVPDPLRPGRFNIVENRHIFLFEE